MGAGASGSLAPAIKAASHEELTQAISDLTPENRKQLAACLEGLEAKEGSAAPEAAVPVAAEGEAKWYGTWKASYSDGSWNDGSIELILKEDKTYHWEFYYVYARDHGGDTSTKDGTWKVEGNLIVCSGGGPKKLEIKDENLMLDVDAPMYCAPTMRMEKA
eukprot:TRINITY_DN110619_c0_g1_i1.p1 TRINITY_DN110619_c0_g1~~TRINITY_DN110619_c0_g1_i1.p1  ORF type:complete len:161 (-),score=34.15 TRINITY_DN110619_c0_g1_i1:296-778(-)